jgi:hypothetical protein
MASCTAPNRISIRSLFGTGEQRGNNKTIARTLDQPLFELVRNSLWRPNDRIMPHWAPATVPLSTHAPAWPRPVSLTLPIRSEGCRRLRTRLPQRVFQRGCLDPHAGIEDTSRGQVRRRVSAFVDQNKSSATSA